MKAFVKSFCVLLCVLLVLPATLLSCSNDIEQEPPKEEITLFANGASEYTIIRSETADEFTRASILDFWHAFSEKFDAEPAYKSDFVAQGEDIPKDQKEILIGNTNRPESQEALKDLKPNSFLIKVINKKLVIVADSALLLANAINYFISNYIAPSDGSIILDSAFTYYRSLDDTPPVTLNSDGSYTFSISDFVVAFDKNGEYTFLRQIAQVFETKAKPYGRVLGVTESEVVNEFEILIGKCNREDYVAPKQEMLFRDFAIYVKNNTISINAISIYGFDRAFDYIFEASENGSITIPADGYYSSCNYGTGAYANMLKNYENPNLDGAWAINVCHRGDVTTNLPENSIPSYQSCIDLRVDVIETDLQRTSDGVWVICHDSTIDRTTNGTGGISTKTLEQIKSYYLREKNGGGSPVTEYTIPTLTEIINLCHGKTLFNLDKLSFNTFQSVYDEFEKLNAVDMAMFKSSGDSAEKIAGWFCELMLADRELPLYSPMIYSKTKNGITAFKGLTTLAETGKTHDRSITDYATECHMRLMCQSIPDPENENFDFYSQVIQVQGYGAIMTDDPVKLSEYIHGQKKR